MAVDAATFRSVLGQWPSGVTVVTTVADDGWHGMTASSFNSVSLEPPLVSVCLAKKIYTHTLIERSGVFAVNILAKDQAAIGKRFAGQQPELTDRFAGLQASTAESGAPVLGDALGWLDCRVVHAYDGGDHTIFVGEVLAADTPRLTAPLLFHSRAWGQFADLLPADAAVVDTGIAAALRAKGADPRRVTELVSALRDAGVAVRVVDLAAGAPSEGELAALRADRDAGPGTASALVATPEHVEAAAALGVGVVEVAVAADPAAAEAARPVIEAARERRGWPCRPSSPASSPATRPPRSTPAPPWPRSASTRSAWTTPRAPRRRSASASSSRRPSRAPSRPRCRCGSATSPAWPWPTRSPRSRAASAASTPPSGASTASSPWRTSSTW